MEPLICTKELTKIYGEGSGAVIALLPCSITIAAGEKVAIVGASGSGKSTLLHLLGGLDRPSQGKVFFEGQDLNQLSDDALSMFRRRKAGYVFQNFSLVPELTAGQNIRLPLMLDGKKAEEAYLEEIARRLDIDDRLTHFPGELSGGQQQRVAIARALSNHPQVLLCDEPTGNLDSKSSAQVVALLQELSAQYGAALVLVTHDGSIAKKMDRTIAITDGRVQDGAAE